MRDSSGHWLQAWLWWWPSSHKQKVIFPACQECASRIRAQRIFREIVFYSIVIAAVVIVIFLLPDSLKPYRKLIALGAAILAVLPWAIYDACVPRIATIDVEKDSTKFVFIDAEFAKRFGEANNKTAFASLS